MDYFMSTRSLRIAIATILMISIPLLVSGVVDLDWMITTYYYGAPREPFGLWDFTPFISMNWWTAYFISLLRSLIGSFMCGYSVGLLTGQVWDSLAEG